MDPVDMIRIKQKFKEDVLENIPAEINAQVRNLGLEMKVKPGQTVAVACSSRGIDNYASIVSALVGVLKEWGLEPFIFPAMGSHGAATAEGQKKILEKYGISEVSLDVPVRSSLETVNLGETKEGVPVFLDKLACRADYVVPVNRVKSHTDFESDIESGLMKMMTVGMGKKRGAAIYHQAFFRWGYPQVILSVAREVLKSGKILFGLASIENGYSQTSKIRVLLPQDIEEEEKGLLKEAKRLEPRLPFEDVDILIIDEMGKDISGSGMDTKVIGRIYLPVVSKEPENPRVKRIVVCDLSEKSDGNALGVGLADFVTKRLVDKVDWEATRVNAMTGGSPEHARIPLAFPNDYKAIEAASQSLGFFLPEDLKVIRIQNTKNLGEVEVSRAYHKSLSGRKDLQIIGEYGPLRFDENGNLESFERR